MPSQTTLQTGYNNAGQRIVLHSFSTSFCRQQQQQLQHAQQQQQQKRRQRQLALHFCASTFMCFSGRCEQHMCKFYLFILFACHVSVCVRVLFMRVCVCVRVYVVKALQHFRSVWLLTRHWMRSSRPVSEASSNCPTSAGSATPSPLLLLFPAASGSPFP